MRGRDCCYCVTRSDTGESTCYEPHHVTYERDELGHMHQADACCDPHGPACDRAIPRHGQYAHGEA